MTERRSYRRKGATPRMVWELFRENEKKAAESRAEWDRKQAESKAEWDRKQAESKAEFDRSRAEFDRRQAELDQKRAEQDRKREEERAQQDRKWAEMVERSDLSMNRLKEEVGRVTNSFGEIVEHLVAPGIEDRFREIGLDFELSGRNLRMKDGKRWLAEIDLLLLNDQSIMAVEVKAKPHIDDIPKHAERLAKLREYHDRHGDRRQILGAIAGAAFGENEKQAALDAGFFVIVQSGDTMKMDIPEGFRPKAW